ncbi:MAG TPA: hypothetical protein VGD64_03290 [Acidisarcina sp.]
MMEHAVTNLAGGHIPQEQASEIRRLAHDLSNSLEIIIQTSYLVGTLDLGADGKRWVEMLDAAVRKAVDINADLRIYIQANSRRNEA